MLGTLDCMRSTKTFLSNQRYLTSLSPSASDSLLQPPHRSRMEEITERSLKARSVIDSFVIAKQRTVPTLEPDLTRLIPTSSKSTKVKVEAVVDGIRKAIEESRVSDGGGSDEGDGRMGKRKKQRMGEERIERMGIRFVADDHPLFELDQLHEASLDPEASIPREFDGIWSFDRVRSRYFPDVIEADCHTHLENTIILALRLLLDPTSGILRVPCKPQRFERATTTASDQSQDGMTDFKGVGTSPGGGRLQHPPLWEIKRTSVFPLMLFRWIRRASEMEGGILLSLEEGQPTFNWPGSPNLDWNRDSTNRKKVEVVLEQVSGRPSTTPTRPSC